MTFRVHTHQTRELSSWRLQNKVAVVTGAARGIGCAVPDNDPLYGSNGPLKRVWKSRKGAHI
jgi:hypothetical protein